MQTSVYEKIQGRLLYRNVRTLTDYNNPNNTPLSNLNIQEAILQATREEEEGVITHANNFTADVFSLVLSPQREYSNAIFVSEKLENRTS